ncbi:MAG: peptidoglycan-associated lipoprotein Pal [Desulfovibrio sp.]|nr:peptidoglycan-associated lipoprotein Pal [Desulfovibrio sp.]
MALLCFSLLSAGCGSKKAAAREQAAQEEQQRILREALDKAASELNVKIFFDFDQAALKPEAKRILTRKAEIMKEYPQLMLTLEGHGDERGTTEYNLGLGKRRAQAASDFLVKQGIASSRLSVVSYGKDRPQDPGHNPAAWAKNRFVEFKASY